MKYAYLMFSMLLTILMFSCTVDTPPEPVRDNPIDLHNPYNGGDPYQLQAEIADGGIRLTWQAVDLPWVEGYNIYRNVDDTTFSFIDTAYHRTTFTDRDIRNGHRYEYYVVAYSFTSEADPSNVASVSVNTDPLLYIEGENVTHTSTRNVTLTILAFGAERMLLSNEPDFARAVWEPYARPRNWLLETGEGTKTVYLKIAYDNGDTSDVITDSIEPAPLNPAVTINDDDETTKTRHVTLQISAAEGALEMRISNVPGSYPAEAHGNSVRLPDSRFGPNSSMLTTMYLTSEREIEKPIINTPGELDDDWIPFTEEIEWELLPGAGTKTVSVQVRNDFLIEEDASDDIEPAPLTGSFLILPEDSSFINHRDVRLAFSGAGVQEIKVANNSDSSSVIWQPFQDTLDWNLSNEDELKHVYAWFRNDFYPPVSAIDSVSLDTQVEVDTFFWTSTGGNTLIPGDEVTFTMVAADDAIGSETGGTATVLVDGWDPITLDDQVDGIYSLTYLITDEIPGVMDALVTASFIDRSGNETEPFIADNRLTFFSAGYERDFELGETGEMITMVWIPAGSFWMGAQDHEVDAEPDEYPHHGVTISESFWLGKYEVTQAQWEAVTGNTPFYFEDHPNRPAERVSWLDIHDDFLPVINATEQGNPWRFPSEAEWEYACRAGYDDTRFWWGDDPGYNDLGEYTWYLDNSDSTTHEVGQKFPNPWGLYDMYGNVSELCEDDRHDNFNGAPGNGQPWIDNPRSNFRVPRGGGWISPARGCRSASRNSTYMTTRLNYFGFRLARLGE